VQSANFPSAQTESLVPGLVWASLSMAKQMGMAPSMGEIVELVIAPIGVWPCWSGRLMWAPVRGWRMFWSSVVMRWVSSLRATMDCFRMFLACILATTSWPR